VIYKSFGRRASFIVEMTGHKVDDGLPGRYDAVVGEELREDRVPHTRGGQQSD